MATKRRKKRVALRVSDAAREKVVALALQHPELGARRLAPLLRKAKIEVSASTVYSILKRRGLQTRAKRQAKLEAQSRKRKSMQKKVLPKITGEAAARIVTLSLQNPDYGAQRLVPMLEADGISISSSAVYRILRRHGLQNRALRLLKLREQQPAAASRAQAAEAPQLPPEAPAEIPLDLAEEIPQEEEEPQPVFPVYAAEAPPVRVVPVSKRPAKTRIQGAGVVTLFNVVLVALLAYLGFYTVQNVRLAGMESQALLVAAAPAVGAVEEMQSDAPPLDGYRAIWQRNLFNLSAEPAQNKEIAVEKLAPAEDDLGLTLVGTVTAGDARLRRAFIDNSKTRKQEAYREGDTAGAVRIKRILRNKVVVATRDGDRVLTSDIFETGRRPAASAPPQPADAGALSAQAEAQSEEEEVAVIDARLDRAQVETGLSEDDYLMKQVTIFPYTGDRGEQLEGFRVSNIRAGNVLLQMGFRSGDVITGVNGQPVRSPDEAAGFFERLTRGGQLTIDISRRRQPLKVRLNIG
jgi:type II secretory pathway component PulC/transposase